MTPTDFLSKKGFIVSGDMTAALEIWMKEYAQLMCDKQKEICSENAETIDIHGGGSYLSHHVVDRFSILKAPYPEELTD